VQQVEGCDPITCGCRSILRPCEEWAKANPRPVWHFEIIRWTGKAGLRLERTFREEEMRADLSTILRAFQVDL
jgi:hypothetical protein